MDEPRKSARVRTVLSGQIVFNNRASTLDCRIRNMSNDGAKIILDDHFAIPQVFEFSVPQKGRTYTAKVIWRQDNEVGIEFINPSNDGSAVGNGHTSRLKELEHENSMLKKRIVELQAELSRHMEMGI